MGWLTDDPTPEQRARSVVTWLMAGTARGEAVDATTWERAITAEIEAALDEQREEIAKLVESAPRKTPAEVASLIRASGSRPKR